MDGGTRRDVSIVPPQGGYVAKRCPLRVHFDLVPPPVDPAPESIVARARMDAGIAFEAEVFETLAEHHPGALVLDDDRPEDEREAETVAALTRGVALVLGGRLPVDEVGRRSGTPDLLVRAGHRPDGRWAYVPVDVKHHKTLSPRLDDDRKPPALVSALATPVLDQAQEDPAWTVGSLRNDALQLAHYHRMLEAIGHATLEGAWGGVIGKERRVAWLDLGAARYRTAFKGDDDQSALDRYDHEFAFRLDVLAAALAGERIVEPVLCGDCDGCPWWGWCGPELDRVDSISLLPLHGYVQWKSHQRAGIDSRADLAGLDRHSALVRDALPETVDIAALLAWADSVGPETPLDGSEAALERLAALDVATAGDLLALDRRALALHNLLVGSSLAGAVDLARVAVHGGGHLYRRRGIDRVIVPEADVDIDIDMESALTGATYLWGALVDDDYVGVAGWDAADPPLEARVFVAFWDWLQEQRRAAAAGGLRLRTWCWSAGAERGALVQGAAMAEAHLGRVGVAAEVAEFVASEQFVDLLHVLRTQLESGGSNGLKHIAPRAGFRWRDETPAGDLSMLWHQQAVAGDETARRRLLVYNEDDVRATAAVRAWLRTEAFPSIADLD